MEGEDALLKSELAASKMIVIYFAVNLSDINVRYILPVSHWFLSTLSNFRFSTKRLSLLVGLIIV